MTPQRRITDKFDPKPLPQNEDERQHQQWYILQEVRFHVSQINGAVADNTEDIIRIDKDVTVARRLGWIALVIIGVVGSMGGLYAAFF